MYRILVVEDEKNTAEPVKEALEMNGFAADVAENGAKALGLFGKVSYDLVLLDLKLPDMSGEDVLRRLRDKDPYVYVVVYTNYSDFVEIKSLTNIGIDGYINKGPAADLKELVGIVQEKLSPLDELGIRHLFKEGARA